MAFSLPSFSQLGASLGFKSGTGSVLGIDIGASSAKIVQLRPAHGAAILETYGEIALGPYGDVSIGKAVKLTPEKTAEAILDLIREANVTARAGGLSIPFSSSLVSVLDMPKVDSDQLKRMIPIEARKYIPLPASEVMLDWFVIPQDEAEEAAFDRITEKTPMQSKGQEVLLVAIHNETVRAYQTIASETGLSIKFYEIEIFSAIRSSLGHGMAPVLVIDLGAATTKMYVVEKGIVRVTHLVTHGGQHMTENLARSLNWDFEKAERIKREHGLVEASAFSADENDKIKVALLSTLERVFSEANRVLLSYGKRYNKNVSRAILTGGGASLPGLAAHANELLQTEVEIANPFARTETPAFLDKVLREIGPGFAVAVGLALRELQHR
ncbi:MAG: type IV pilus assembly protein PilM [Parcubacteria group bacterium Gr01-1014_8]|nr:MAG: type IV pilus assembly protein PilM [Parcubacteria group bacterium Gr01-1014_8]